MHIARTAHFWMESCVSNGYEKLPDNLNFELGQVLSVSLSTGVGDEIKSVTMSVPRYRTCNGRSDHPSRSSGGRER